MRLHLRIHRVSEERWSRILGIHFRTKKLERHLDIKFQIDVFVTSDDDDDKNDDDDDDDDKGNEKDVDV